MGRWGGRDSPYLNLNAIDGALDAGFNESDHPRDHGKFTSGAGSAGGEEDKFRPPPEESNLEPGTYAHEPVDPDSTPFGGMGDKIKALAKTTRPTRVPYNTLVPTQNVLDEDKVDEFVNALDDGEEFPAPVAVQYKGKNYITDGHHRAVAMKEAYGKNIPVKIVKYEDLVK